MFLKLILVSLFSICDSEAQELALIEAKVKLPGPRDLMSSAYDGDDSIYLFGGYWASAWQQEVFRYSIESDTIEIIGAVPTGLGGGSAVWVGNENLLYIGGLANGSARADIYLTASNPINWNVIGRLPTGAYYTKSIWDGATNTYIIGGNDLGTISNYSSITNTALLVAQIPRPLLFETLAFDDKSGNIYIFGGKLVAGGDPIDEILKFNLASKTVTKLDVVLPVPISDACAVWTGNEVYLIGGMAARDTDVPPLVRFNPTTNEIHSVPVKNSPLRFFAPSCAFSNKLNRIYILGGMVGGNRDEIMYIDLNPCQGQESGTVIPNSFCCESFYICVLNTGLLQHCPPGEQFSRTTLKCELQGFVRCERS